MTNGASLKSFSGATNPSRKESSNMLKQNFSPTAGSAPVRGVGVRGGRTLHISVSLMLNLRRRTCKIRSPSRMRPSLAAMLLGLICRRQNKDI